MKSLITVLVFSLIIISNALNAATYTSLKNGNWNDPTTWSGGKVPKNNDVVIISHNITLDKDISDVSITINSGASLRSTSYNIRINNGGNLNVAGALEVNNLQFDNGSHILIAPTGEVDVHTNFLNKNNSNDVVIDGSLEVSGNFSNETGGLIVGKGEIYCAGDYLGNGITYNYDPTSSIPSGSRIVMRDLPVKLTLFTAQLVNGKAVINWTTATELNNNKFELYKSTNGIDFVLLTTLKGAGTSNVEKNYSYTDADIKNNTIYYQLKQIDFDGKSQISDIIALVSVNSNSSCELNVKPNPCIGKCFINFNNCENEDYSNVNFLIYDALGNVVYTSVPQTIEGGTATFTYDVHNNLKPAVYIIKGVGTKEKVSDKKVIIQK